MVTKRPPQPCASCIRGFLHRHGAAAIQSGIETMEILETSAVVDGDKIKEYQTHVRIRFRIER